MTIEERLKKAKPLLVKADTSRLAPGDTRALQYCVEAARIINDLYFEQVYPASPTLRMELEKRNDPEGHALLRYFLLHGGPWDLWQDSEPFIGGIGVRLLGAGFYPPDLTKEEWEASLAACNNGGELLKNPYTLVGRDSATGKLEARWYHNVWRKQLQEIRSKLAQAAACATDVSLAAFLVSRGEDLLSDTYGASEAAWINTAESPIEVTLGPYEVYQDRLYNTKACYGAALVIRDAMLSEAAKQYTVHLEEFDALLAKVHDYIPHGQKTPMVIGDLYFGAGGVSHSGYQTMAYNLPNDERITELHGSKKVFFKNIMYAKFETFTRVIAQRLWHPGIASRISPEAFVLFVVGHEIAHGVGPEIVLATDGGRITVKQALGNLHSLLEEAKADVLGLVYLRFLAEKGLVTPELVRAAELTHLIDILRTLRFGLHEDHARGVLLQYNWLKHEGCIIQDSSGKFSTQELKLPVALQSLAHAIMKVQRASSYQVAQQFVERWSTVPPELEGAIAQLGDLAIDFEPMFALS